MNLVVSNILSTFATELRKQLKVTIMANIDKDKYNVQYGRIFINKRIEELNTRKEDFVTFRYYRKKQREYGKSIQMPYDDALTLSHWRMDDGRYKNFLFVIDSNE